MQHIPFSLGRILALAVAFTLLAPAATQAQRGGRGGGAGMRGGISGGFHGGVGGFGGGFVGRGAMRGGFNRRAFGFGSPFGFYGSFGYGYWPAYGLGYGYWPDYSYGYWGYPYPYYPSYPQVMVLGPGAASSEADTSSKQTETGRSAPTEPYWLIALKDGTILLVTDYSSKDSTLSYVTRDGKEASIDLSKVDFDLTSELNRERGLEFQVPRAKSKY